LEGAKLGFVRDKGLAQTHTFKKKITAHPDLRSTKIRANRAISYAVIKATSINQFSCPLVGWVSHFATRVKITGSLMFNRNRDSVPENLFSISMPLENLNSYFL